MRQSSGQQQPPDDESYVDEEPFNPSQLLVRIYRLFTPGARPARSAKSTSTRKKSSRSATKAAPKKKSSSKGKQTAEPSTPGAQQLAARMLPVLVLILLILIIAPSLPVLAASGLFKALRNLTTRPITVEVMPEAGESLQALQIAPVFTQEVDYWAEDIAVWALTYDLHPNLIATVMQIESCGDPSVASNVGASGLFQVMPFHFEEGEEHLDPETNARVGLSFLAHLLELSDGDVAGALAGYNAGQGQIDTPYEYLPAETQRYVYWGTGIYAEAETGAQESARLAEWLANGGYVLCNRAAGRLGLSVTPYPPSPVPEVEG